MAWQKANKKLIGILEDAMLRFKCERKMMFGAPTFFINGNMFAGVHQDTVIIRLSETDREQIFSLHKEVRPFVPMAGHTMKEYAALPESLCSNTEVFTAWLNRSYQYASALPRKAAKKSKATGK